MKFMGQNLIHMAPSSLIKKPKNPKSQHPPPQTPPPLPFPFPHPRLPLPKKWICVTCYFKPDALMSSRLFDNEENNRNKDAFTG